EVRETTLGAYAHQDLPFERLVEELRPERSLTHNPLFQVMLALQNAPLPELALGELALRPVDVPLRRAKFDLFVELHRPGEEMVGNVEWSAGLFDEVTVGRLCEGFVRLLAGALASPACALAELPLLDAGQRQQIVREWQGQEGEGELSPGSATVDALVWAQIARAPDATALVAGEERLSYGELGRRAREWARVLRGWGI